MFGLSIYGIALGSLGILITSLYLWGKWQQHQAKKYNAELVAEQIKAKQAEHRIKQRTELDHELDALHERQRLERVEQYKRYEANKSLRDGLNDIGVYDGTENNHGSGSASDS